MSAVSFNLNKTSIVFDTIVNLKERSMLSLLKRCSLMFQIVQKLPKQNQFYSARLKSNCEVYSVAARPRLPLGAKQEKNNQGNLHVTSPICEAYVAVLGKIRLGQINCLTKHCRKSVREGNKG